MVQYKQYDYHKQEKSGILKLKTQGQYLNQNQMGKQVANQISYFLNFENNRLNEQAQKINMIFLTTIIVLIMINRSEIDKEKDSIFPTLSRGTRKISESHQSAIVLLGPMKVGKSTAFNWALNQQIIGNGEQNACYICPNPQPNYADQKTLIPNIQRDYQPNLSLIDMPGLGFIDDYVRVVGVSYFFQTLFEQVRKAKFVLVISEEILVQSSSVKFLKTLQNFTNMFKLPLMSKQVTKQLKKSLSVLVTRAKYPESYIQIINQHIQHLKNQDLIVENRDLIKQLLIQIRDSGRVQSFMAARKHCPPQQCKFIKNLNNLDWQFFDFGSIEKQLQQPLITLPFSSQFSNLALEQKQAFDKLLRNKIKSFLTFQNILKEINQNIISNWEDFLEAWNKDKLTNFNNFGFSSFFEEVKKFIENNDIYDSKHLATVKSKVSYEAPNFLQSINIYLKLQRIVQKVIYSSHQQLQRIVKDAVSMVETKQWSSLTFQQTMQKYKGYFAQIVQIMKICSSNHEEELLLETTKLILTEGFTLFQKLYEFKPGSINDIKVRLRDGCHHFAFQFDSIEFRQLFINKLNEKLLVKLFPSQQAMKQYELFFKQFVKEKKQSVAYQKRFEVLDKTDRYLAFNQQMINKAKEELRSLSMVKLPPKPIRKRKIDSTFKPNDLEGSIAQLSKQYQISVFVSGMTQFDQKQKYHQLQHLFQKQADLLTHILGILKKRPAVRIKNEMVEKFQNANHLNLFKQTQYVLKLISSASKNSQKFEIYQKYTNFCEKSLDLSASLKQLDQKFTFQSYDLARITSMMKKKQVEQAIIIQRIENLKTQQPKKILYLAVQKILADFETIIYLIEHQS